jgi:hypothetical protein
MTAVTGTNKEDRGMSLAAPVDHLSEHAVDEALAGRLARARRYLGWPLLFLMRLRPAGETAC